MSYRKSRKRLLKQWAETTTSWKVRLLLYVVLGLSFIAFSIIGLEYLAPYIYLSEDSFLINLTNSFITIAIIIVYYVAYRAFLNYAYGLLGLDDDYFRSSSNESTRENCTHDYNIELTDEEYCEKAINPVHWYAEKCIKCNKLTKREYRRHEDNNKPDEPSSNLPNTIMFLGNRSD